MILINLYNNTALAQGQIDSSIFNSIAINLGYTSKYYFYLKLAFILFLVILHLFFIFSQDEAIQREYQQNGLNNLIRVLKEQASTVVALATYYAAYTTFNAAVINQEIVQEQAESRKLIAVVASLQEESEASLKRVKDLGIKVSDFEMKSDQIKSNNGSVKENLDSMEKADNSITKYFNEIQATTSNEEKTLLQAKLLDVIQKRNHFREEIKAKIDKNQELANEMSIIKDSISSQINEVENTELKDNDTKTDNLLEDDIIKKSTFFDPDWFNGLSALKQLSVALVISQGVVLSALTTIIFIFYGQILIDKFNLEVKYPKLSTIIKYRKQFNKYYFIHSCCMIIIISLGQIGFSVAILSS